MKSIKKERGVLKLVHPGRYIEIHREPIIALEVMRKNPRHSITRPDVFKHPWIVVKPESVLVPGSVFLIVPNHTIYNLLKVKEQNNNDSLSFHQQHGVGPSWFGDTHVRHGMSQISTSWTQSNFFGNDIGQDLVSVEVDNVNPTCFSQLNQYSPNYHVDYCKFKYDDCEGMDKLWTKVTSCEDIEKESMQHDLSLDESNSEFTPYQLAVQYYQNQYKGGIIGMEMAEKDVKLEFVANEQVNKLKSCLRKPNSIRKWSNLTVSFDISVKKEE